MKRFSDCSVTDWPVVLHFCVDWFSEVGLGKSYADKLSIGFQQSGDLKQDATPLLGKTATRSKWTNGHGPTWRDKKVQAPFYTQKRFGTFDLSQSNQVYVWTSDTPRTRAKKLNCHSSVPCSERDNELEPTTQHLRQVFCLVQKLNKFRTPTWVSTVSIVALPSSDNFHGSVSVTSSESNVPFSMMTSKLSAANFMSVMSITIQSMDSRDLCVSLIFSITTLE